MRTSGARLLGLAACVVLAGCSAIGDVLGGGDAVLDTGIEPISLEVDGPAYMVPTGRREIVVHAGGTEQRLRGTTALRWLPGGNGLVLSRGRARVVDPGEGFVGGSYGYWHDPGRSTELVSSVRDVGSGEFVLTQYDLSLHRVRRVELPGTDIPDAQDLEVYRNYYGAVPTIDGTTFVKWHDGSETYEDGDYGVLMIDEKGEMTNVLPNSNVVGLYLSADGTGLLGLRQVRGEPCGGCNVDQDIVEIDPETGEIAAEYGVPDPYDEDWQVAGMDKVGDRVAVRWYEPIQERNRFTYEQRGTWVYDGEWSLLPGSTDELTWWQGEIRVVARVNSSEARRGDGFDLFWVDGEEETRLDVELSEVPLGAPATAAFAGQYLPPED